MESTEIVIGTYENIILGFRIIKNARQDANPYSLDTSFTDDTHRGALRSMSVSANGVLASSSTDDSIRLHSLKKRKEIGGLFEHNGTVNYITFFERSLMFSASEDGKICLWKTKNWELLRTLKGHKAQVMSVTIHPTGKLALSVGSDKSLLTWDLTTGKLAFQRKIKEVAQQIVFTPSGDHYILVYSKAIEVCSVEDTQVVQETEMTWRINTFCHIQDNVYAVGGDDRHVFVINILSGDKILTLDMARSGEDAFRGRVRCISAAEVGEDGCQTVVVGTSSGDIKAFAVNVNEDEEGSEEILSYAAGVRMTCMALYTPVTSPNGKENGKTRQAARAQVEEEKHEKGTEDDEEEPVTDDENGQETYDEEEESVDVEVQHQSPKKRKQQEKKNKQTKRAKQEKMNAGRKMSTSPDKKPKKKKIKVK